MYLGDVTRSKASKKLHMLNYSVSTYSRYVFTYKPATSSILSFRTSSNCWITGSFHNRLMSSAHACNTTPGSFGSFQSIRNSESRDSLASFTSRPKASFQPVVELTHASLILRPLSIYPAAPLSVSFRTSDSSIWIRGDKRNFSFW